MIDILISNKSQFDKLENWEKYEILESLEQFSHYRNAQVKIKAKQSYNSINFEEIDVIKSDQLDKSYYSPLELLNIFDN